MEFIRTMTNIKQWKYRLTIISFCFFVILIFSGYSTSQRNPEYQVKSVFIYNFSQFVEWPASAFPGSDSPFIIGILGRDPFGSYLNETVKGETINGHPFSIKKCSRPEDAFNCHILYIGENNKSELQKIINTLRGKNILTVSDVYGFARMGGIIEFSEKENKIGLKINAQAAKNARLEISSKLLRLAEVVSY